jgi:hypothetical protein
MSVVFRQFSSTHKHQKRKKERASIELEQNLFRGENTQVVNGPGIRWSPNKNPSEVACKWSFYIFYIIFFDFSKYSMDLKFGKTILQLHTTRW